MLIKKLPCVAPLGFNPGLVVKRKQVVNLNFARVFQLPFWLKTEPTVCLKRPKINQKEAAIILVPGIGQLQSGQQELPGVVL